MNTYAENHFNTLTLGLRAMSDEDVKALFDNDLSEQFSAVLARGILVDVISLGLAGEEEPTIVMDIWEGDGSFNNIHDKHPAQNAKHIGVFEVSNVGDALKRIQTAVYMNNDPSI